MKQTNGLITYYQEDPDEGMWDETSPEHAEAVVITNGDDFYQLSNIHPFSACKGRTCVIHTPTNHHMRDWYLHWRSDRAIFERICEHGIGHPDPDQFAFWDETYQSARSVHGCDGCC